MFDGLGPGRTEDESRTGSSAVMGDREFEQIACVAAQHVGIKMPIAKKAMVASRLLRRLNALGLPTYRAYCDLISTNAGFASEYPHLIDLLTTHKTSFFREADHFDILASRVLPAVLEARKDRRISVWSAGCSTGEEAYTLAMVLANAASHFGKLSISILGTDVSPLVVEAATLGIYREASAEEIPLAFRKRYLLRSKDAEKGLVRVVPELRAMCRFTPLNFMSAQWPIPQTFDVIFCRNVLIYFSATQQAQIVSGLSKRLSRSGHLFLGHSEAIEPARFGLVQVDRAVFVTNGATRQGQLR